MPNCAICKEEYAQERFDLGYEICLSCAEKTVKRYLGRRSNDSKHRELAIFRENLETVKKILKRESSAGFNANLSFGSYSAVNNEDKE
jgi:hypothetical protein